METARGTTTIGEGRTHTPSAKSNTKYEASCAFDGLRSSTTNKYEWKVKMRETSYAILQHKREQIPRSSWRRIVFFSSRAKGKGIGFEAL